MYNDPGAVDIAAHLRKSAFPSGVEPLRKDFPRGKKGDQVYEKALDAFVVAWRRTIESVQTVLTGLDTHYSRNLNDLVVNGRWYDIAHIAMPDPRLYATGDEFAADYLAYNLLRKGNFLPTGEDQRGVAIGKFLISEEKCRVLNQNSGRSYCQITSGLATSHEAVIHTAQRLIRDLIGSFSWAKVERYFGFSGGASTRLPKKSGHPFYKFQGNPHVTVHASTAAWCAIQNTPAWVTADPQGQPKLTYVVGSKADTVPKDAKSDRFICVEPDMNMYLQRGIGGYFRRVLLLVGIDLNDQSINQLLAQIGSRTGSLVTIDLAAASDSIAMELVRALFDADWYDAMCMLRSPFATLPDGTVHRLEKISSMGNGYTFELESLIFWALARAVQIVHGCEDRRLGVYGDDIVIHNSIASHLIDVLDYVGFETNASKTFIDGPFRESCGKHYFHGQDVTPFNIKQVIQFDEDKNRFFNELNVWLSREHVQLKDGLRMLRKLHRKNRLLVHHVPPHLGTEAGVWVPGVQDAATLYVFRENRDPTQDRQRARSFVGGYLHRSLRPVRRKHNPGGSYALLTWLASATTRPTQSCLQIEKGEVVYQRFTRYTTYWPDAPVRFVVRQSGVSLA